MFAQNTVKIVPALKNLQSYRNTEVFLGRTGQVSRNDWLEMVGILSSAMMEDTHVSGSVLWF